MIDLETRLHDEVGGTVRSYRPTPDLPQRIRRRTTQRRRRIAIARATSFVAVVVLVGGLVANRAGVAPHTQVSTAPTRPPASTKGAPVTLPAVAHAPGARPVDFEGYRIWVPANFRAYVVGGGPCGAIDVIPNAYASQLPTCGQVIHGQDVLQLTPLVRPLAATARRTRIDGYEAWGPVIDPSDPSFERYDVPALGVRILVHGAGPRQVLATLGPSSRSAVFAARPLTPAPAGWHTVRYQGIELRVPPSWPVQAAGMYPCGSGLPSPPQVWLGAATGEPPCAPPIGPSSPADGLWLQTIPTNADFGPSPTLVRDGAVKIYGAGGTDPIAQLELVVGRQRIEMTIGLGTDPSTAERIIDSIERA